jgi:nucleoside-diphosphate-sugar epimerase
MPDSPDGAGHAQYGVVVAASHRALLTGATGFVGPHVVDAFLRAGTAVRALYRSERRAREIERPGVQLVRGSIEDADALRTATAGMTTVVHMAALTHARSDAAYQAVNVDGTRRVLEAALAPGSTVRRLVFLSSLAAAGPAIDGRAVRADDPPRPLTAYGRSKLAAERVCREAADRMEVIILRAPAVYGPRDTDLFHFFRLAKWGLVPVPTGGDRPLQMVHVEDLAAAVVRAAAARGVTGVYHIAEARAYPWERLGRMVGDAVGRRTRIIRVPPRLVSGLAAISETVAGAAGRSVIFNRDKAREMLAPGWLCETEAARADLGFEAGISLADGLRTTAQWYRQHGWL